MLENEENIPSKTPNKNFIKLLTGISYILTIVSLLIGFAIIPGSIILTPTGANLPTMLITIALTLFISYYVMISDEEFEVHGKIIMLINFLLFFLLTSGVHINIA